MRIRHEHGLNELGNELGNAIQRTQVMIQNYLNGELPPAIDDTSSNDTVDKFIAKCKFDRAIDEIWLKVKSLNQYIEDEKPWTLNKNNETDKLKEVLDNQTHKIREISSLLKPFLPETSEKIDKMFSGIKLDVPDGTLFPRIDEPTKV